ncbi:MAG: substrate-binding domain-containing protein [Pseudomonadota bacterium]
MLFFFCIIVGTAMAEEVKVGAGAAPVENIFERIKVPMEKEIGLSLILNPSGPVQALKDLDAGLIDAAAGGISFQEWIGMMEKDNYSIKDKNVYRHQAIGKDVVKVIIHKEIRIPQLSKDQLTGIFTGKTKNWSDVGGPNLPIIVVTGTKIPGTLKVFQSQIMNQAGYTDQALESTTAEEMKKKVISTPGAVCLGTMSAVDDTIQAPDIPVVWRPITLITKGEPAGSVKKMIDYIKGDGQRYILK